MKMTSFFHRSTSFDFRRNDSIIAESNLKKLIRNQNQIENIIDKDIINIQLDNDYNQIDKNEKSIKIEIFDFNKL